MRKKDVGLSMREPAKDIWNFRCRSPMYTLNYLEKYYRRCEQGKYFSRSNLDDGRDHIVSLLKATEWFLIKIRMGLFRCNGSCIWRCNSLPSHLKFCRVKSLLSFQLHLLHILVQYTPIAGAIFLVPEPSQTFLLPLHLLFLLPERLFPLNLCRTDSLLLSRSHL